MPTTRMQDHSWTRGPVSSLAAILASIVGAECLVRRMALEERIDNIGKSDRKIKRKRKDEEDVRPSSGDDCGHEF